MVVVVPGIVTSTDALLSPRALALPVLGAGAGGCGAGCTGAGCTGAGCTGGTTGAGGTGGIGRGIGTGCGAGCLYTGGCGAEGTGAGCTRTGGLIGGTTGAEGTGVVPGCGAGWVGVIVPWNPLDVDPWVDAEPPVVEASEREPAPVLTSSLPARALVPAPASDEQFGSYLRTGI